MEFKESEKNVLYPTLLTAPTLAGGQRYHLQKNLSKKYHRAVKVISNLDSTLVATSMSLGVASEGLLSTIIVAPTVIAMGATALGTGLLGIIGSEVNKRLMRKAEKHETFKVLAEANLNAISYLISKALVDNKISDEEYSLVCTYKV